MQTTEQNNNAYSIYQAADDIAEQLAAGFVRLVRDKSDPAFYLPIFHEYTHTQAAERFPDKPLSGQKTVTVAARAVNLAVEFKGAVVKLVCADPVHNRVVSKNDPIDLEAFFEQYDVLRAYAIRNSATATELKEYPIGSVTLQVEVDAKTLARLEHTMEFDCSGIQEHAENLLIDAAKALYEENERARLLPRR